MSKILTIALLLILSVGSVEAQSKRELKAMAKRQEMVNATTDENGDRWLFKDKKLTHLKIRVRSCRVIDNSLVVHTTIYNSADADDKVTLYGRLYTSAKDSDGKLYYGGNTLYYGDDLRGRGREKLEDIILPAGGALKISFRFEECTTNPTMLSEFQFGLQSDYYGNTASKMGYVMKWFEPNIIDMQITK